SLPPRNLCRHALFHCVRNADGGCSRRLPLGFAFSRPARSEHPAAPAAETMANLCGQVEHVNWLRCASHPAVFCSLRFFLRNRNRWDKLSRSVVARDFRTGYCDPMRGTGFALQPYAPAIRPYPRGAGKVLSLSLFFSAIVVAGRLAGLASLGYGYSESHREH